MKKVFLLATLLIIAAGDIAAQHICRGNSTFYSNIVYTYDDRYIYSGSQPYYSNIVYTYDDRYIYSGS